MRVIALTGPPCSGKETVKDILFRMCARRGLRAAHLSFSGEIRREALSCGMSEADLDRDALTRLVAEMRAQEGPGVLAKRIVQRVRETPADVHIVEAVRHPAEAEILRGTFGEDYRLAAVTADVGTMVRRLLARPRADESRTARRSPHVAEQLIRREIQGDEEAGVLVGRCIEMADVTIPNDGTLDDLARRVRARLGDFLDALT